MKIFKDFFWGVSIKVFLHFDFFRVGLGQNAPGQLTLVHFTNFGNDNIENWYLKKRVITK